MTPVRLRGSARGDRFARGAELCVQGLERPGPDDAVGRELGLALKRLDGRFGAAPEYAVGPALDLIPELEERLLNGLYGSSLRALSKRGAAAGDRVELGHAGEGFVFQNRRRVRGRRRRRGLGRRRLACLAWCGRARARSERIVGRK